VTYLLDTNVLPETRKRRSAPGVAEWIAATPADRLYVSVLTLGEIEQGITRIRNKGDQQQAAALERCLREVEAGFAEGIIPVTLCIASEWGRQRLEQAIPRDRRAHRGNGQGAWLDRGDPQRQGFRASRSPGT
jgi:toxin FitB